MSLDSFQIETDNQDTHKFFSNNLPNTPPSKEVDRKVATDMELISDEDIINSLEEFWHVEDDEDKEVAIKICFNDGSTWYWALPKLSSKTFSRYEYWIERYIPEVIRWKAKQNGKDPNKAVREWEEQRSSESVNWEELLENTGISEETRRWLNRNADWMPRISKKIESRDEEVDLDVDKDEDWTDDL